MDGDREHESPPEQGVEGWFWPTGARKCHYDQGNGIALCGKWGRINPFNPRAAASIQGAPDAAPSRDDCATCRRKLEARRS